MAKKKTSRLTQKPAKATRTITVKRSAAGGCHVVKDRVGAAVKDAQQRYGETLRRLK